MPVLEPAMAIKRLFSRCIPDYQTECINWTGMVNHKGYGMVRFGGKMRTTHRVVYEMRVDQIPEGMHVLHHCDNPICCNKNHLFLGTNRDNIDDKIAKDRSGKKLNIEKVRQIKRLLFNGVKQSEIAAEFGVARSIISRISTGHRWAHITNEGG